MCSAKKWCPINIFSEEIHRGNGPSARFLWWSMDTATKWWRVVTASSPLLHLACGRNRCVESWLWSWRNRCVGIELSPSLKWQWTNLQDWTDKTKEYRGTQGGHRKTVGFYSTLLLKNKVNYWFFVCFTFHMAWIYNRSGAKAVAVALNLTQKAKNAKKKKEKKRDYSCPTDKVTRLDLLHTPSRLIRAVQSSELDLLCFSSVSSDFGVQTSSVLIQFHFHSPSLTRWPIGQ